MRTKEDLFNYIGKEDSVYGYSRSYKLVLFRILFTDLWEGKRSYLYDVAAQFKDFYVKRMNEGKIPDKDVDERIEKAEQSSLSDILEIIRINPYKHINANGFLEIMVDDKGEYFSFPLEIMRNLTRDEIFSMIYRLYRKLSLYFSRIDASSSVCKVETLVVPQLGDKEVIYADFISNIVNKFTKLNSDAIIDKILDSKEEYDTICEIIRAILRWKRLSYLTLSHKELIALFLVGTAKYHYNDGEGGFWSRVEQIIPQIHVNNHSDIVKAFDDVIKRYNLPDFHEAAEEGYKLIAPIICHAGIPINCLDSWFDVVYYMRGIKYNYLENEAVYACRYADKPVKRYINFLLNRGIFADEVQHVQELIGFVVSNKEIPDNLDFSLETKMEAVKWAQNKASNKNCKFEKYASPELIFDNENCQLNVRLPKMKLKDETSILWEVVAGETVRRKKVYGKQVEGGYFFSDYEIIINPESTITARLYNNIGQVLDEYHLKTELDCLVFNHNGKQNRGKFLSKKPSYFICESDFDVCSNLHQIAALGEFIIYENDPNAASELWVRRGNEEMLFYVREKAEIVDGKILFDGGVDFEDVDVYYNLPRIAVPFNGEWEVSITKNSEERFDTAIYADKYISIEDIILDSFENLEHGVYKIRIKHDKSGYSTFKIIYSPYCSMSKTGFYPNNDGYEVSRLRFSCPKNVQIFNTRDEEVFNEEISIADSIFEGNVCFRDASIPFHVHLKAFTWEIFNEEKSFGADNKRTYISSNDIRESEWVMLNIHNHTQFSYTIEISCGETYQRKYSLFANRKFSFNLKEISESIDTATSLFSTVSIKVSDAQEFIVCSIKKQIHIRKLTADKTEDNNILISWEEDGALTDRELVVADSIFPYKQTIYPIEDGKKETLILREDLKIVPNWMIYIQQRENVGNSIYDVVDEKKKVLKVKKIFSSRKKLLTYTKADFELMIKEEGLAFQQLMYCCLFIKFNGFGQDYKKVELELSTAYRDKVIEYRVRYGDAALYRALFEYDVSEEFGKFLLKYLSLAMPYFLKTDVLSVSEEVLLKEQNLLAYAYYVYITHQDKKFEMLKREVEYLTDEESFMLAKADLLFPAYYNFEEVNKSVKQWKSVQINGKWLNEAEALNYALVDIILDDLNPRLKRVNLKYADAIYSFYIKHKKTFLQAFIHRLERKRR